MSEHGYAGTDKAEISRGLTYYSMRCKCGWKGTPQRTGLATSQDLEAHELLALSPDASLNEEPK